MAKKTLLVSDLTGEPIDDKDYAKLTIRYSDARRGQIGLDVNAEEIAEIAAKGIQQARRGRKPKVAA
jgi:hypothetical protein